MTTKEVPGSPLPGLAAGLGAVCAKRFSSATICGSCKAAGGGHTCAQILSGLAGTFDQKKGRSRTRGARIESGGGAGTLARGAGGAAGALSLPGGGGGGGCGGPFPGGAGGGGAFLASNGLVGGGAGGGGGFLRAGRADGTAGTGVGAGLAPEGTYSESCPGPASRQSFKTVHHLPQIQKQDKPKPQAFHPDLASHLTTLPRQTHPCRRL